MSSKPFDTVAHADAAGGAPGSGRPTGAPCRSAQDHHRAAGRHDRRYVMLRHGVSVDLAELAEVQVER
ncbi:MAG: hypothetical protein U0Q22_16275 [Acidimicrobiales bacterium]